MRKLLAAAALLLLFMPTLPGRSYSGRRTSTRSYTSRFPSRSKKPSNYCYTCERDSRGRIKRSRAAIDEFRRRHPCPATGKVTGACPGWQIDHMVSLNKGGADEPNNMHWLTDGEHRAKHSEQR